MKFTNGYWLIRNNFTMTYATQAIRIEKTEKSLHVLTAGIHVRGRGDMMGGGTLDVTFTAPRENIIRVQVTHFAGVRPKEPRFETYEEEVQPEIAETEKEVVFRSGRLSAHVSKSTEQWRVDYYDGEKLLTSSEYHSMGHAKDKSTGKTYMSESLMLDVGECVVFRDCLKFLFGTFYR